MHCRNCGHAVLENAAVCTNCGYRPRQGQSFCWNCGADTAAGQAVCVKCGVALTSTGSAGGKSKVTAGLLAMLLGSFGIHKFYLGYNKAGLIMLLVWVFGWLLFAIPTSIISTIAFIEGIIYLIKSDAEFDETYVFGERQWF